MKNICLLAVLALFGSVACAPLEDVPLVVKTQVGDGPTELTVVAEADDVDDVVEAAAKKAVDPHGLLDDDVVESIIDPHDTLEDDIERAVRPLKAAEEAREDAADRLEDALERERDILEDARSAEEDRREDIKDRAEDAIERQLDPTGRLGVDVDIVDPRDPDDLDDLHEIDDDDDDSREVKVVLSESGAPKTLVQSTKSLVRNELGPVSTQLLKEAKIREKTREAVADIVEEQRELAEDIREINRGKI